MNNKMSCNPGIGTFCSPDNTWTPSCGTLQPTVWHPYDETLYPVENYGSCSYNCSAGYGRGCGCGGQSGYRCSPYNKLDSQSAENYYDTLSTEWSTAANITPANSNLKYEYTHWNKKPKYSYENYSTTSRGCCNPGTYRSLNTAWKEYRKYRLG